MANEPCRECGSEVVTNPCIPAPNPCVTVPATCVPENPCPGSIPLTQCPPDPCLVVCTPPLQLDACAIFYHKSGCSESKLTCLAIPNGISIEKIVEEIDIKLCQATNTYDYDTYYTPCLDARYSIITHEDFVEAADAEFCRLGTIINNSNSVTNTAMQNLITEVNNIKYPDIYNPFQSGFDHNSTINEILQAITNILYEQQTGDSSTDLTTTIDAQVTSTVDMRAIPSSQGSVSTFALVSAGTASAAPASYTLQSYVKVGGPVNVSGQVQANQLRVNSDGLYVAPVAVPNQLQSLVWTTASRQLTLTGANTVTIEGDAPQVLSLNPTTNVLSLSGGGGSADLGSIAPNYDQPETSISTIPSPTIGWQLSGLANHTLFAEVLLKKGDNAIKIDNGLYVEPAIHSDIARIDSASIAITVSGADQHTISANLIKDVIKGGNALEIGPNGVYVATSQETPNTKKDTKTAITTLTGSPLYREICVDVRVAPAPNLLEITNDGLLVTPAAGGGTDTNFATSDLVANAHRHHDFANKTLTIDNVNTLSLVSGIATDSPFSSIGSNKDPLISLYAKSSTSELGITIDGKGTTDTIALKGQSTDHSKVIEVDVTPNDFFIKKTAGGVTRNIQAPMPVNNGFFVMTVNGQAANATGNIDITAITDTHFANTDLTLAASRRHLIPIGMYYSLTAGATTIDFPPGPTTNYLQRSDMLQLFAQTDNRHKTLLQATVPSDIPKIVIEPTIYQVDGTTIQTQMHVEITDTSFTVQKNGGTAREVARSVVSGGTTYYADTNGNINLSIPASGLITADNGLTANTSNVQLGGPLIKATVLTTGTQQFTIQGSSAVVPVIQVNSSGAAGSVGLKSTAQDGTAIYGDATAGTGVLGIGTIYGIRGVSSVSGGVGVSASTNLGIGVDSASTGSIAGNFVTTVGAATGHQDVLHLSRKTMGATPADGIGAGMSFYVQAAGAPDDGLLRSNQLISVLTNANSAGYTSRFEIRGIYNADPAGLTALLQLTGQGQLTLPKYGDGTFKYAGAPPNPPSFLLGVDSNGNVIESLANTLYGATPNSYCKTAVTDYTGKGYGIIDAVDNYSAQDIAGNKTFRLSTTTFNTTSGAYHFLTIDTTANAYNGTLPLLDSDCRNPQFTGAGTKICNRFQAACNGGASSSYIVMQVNGFQAQTATAYPLTAMTSLQVNTLSQSSAVQNIYGIYNSFTFNHLQITGGSVLPNVYANYTMCTRGGATPWATCTNYYGNYIENPDGTAAPQITNIYGYYQHGSSGLNVLDAPLQLTGLANADTTKVLSTNATGKVVLVAGPTLALPPNIAFKDQQNHFTEDQFIDSNNLLITNGTVWSDYTYAQLAAANPFSGNYVKQTISSAGTHPSPGNAIAGTISEAQFIAGSGGRSINNDVAFSASVNIIRLINTHSSTVTMAQGGTGFLRAMSAGHYFVAHEPGSISNTTASFSHVAGIVSGGIFQSGIATNLPIITNYYGLIVGAALQDPIDTANTRVTNVWGIWQDGYDDPNMFKGSTTFQSALQIITGKISPAPVRTAQIGFFNQTPVAQQAGGAKTIAATYGTNEQDALNKVYQAMRNYGLIAQ